MSSESISHLRTPLQRLYHWEAQQANKNFLHQPVAGQWHTWTWGEAATAVRKMAAAIEAQGFEPGSRIAILSRNCAQWIMSDLAIMMSGHISVPIYPNVKQDTVSYILDHSDVKMMFVGKLETHDWTEMRQGVSADLPCVKYGMYGLDADYPTWDEFCGEHEPKADSPSRDLDEVMTIIYTSGTTGTPKGVVQKFVAPVYAFETFHKIFSLSSEDRFFSYLPLSHIAERMLITMGSLRSGGSIHFAQSLDTFADNLKTCSPTVFLGVPRIWTKFQMGVLAKFPPSRLNLLLSIPLINNIIKKKIKEALGLSEARICLTGAAPIPVSTLEWYDKLGVNILEVYGMTENAAYSHSNLPGKQKYGTVGQTMPGVEMKITDEGEICVKSLANMVEYYREPEKTAATIRDGFLHTGDKGEMDAEGFVRITGRVKDIFKTSKAKYVAPSPIEMKFSKNELVEQICVVGTGIPQPIALIVLSEDAKSKPKDEVGESIEATLKALNPNLDHHERLQKAVIVSEEWTPENSILTPTLKIKRGAIDDKYQIHYEKWYDGGVGVVWEN
ncbi:MAG: AMP-binding protein [Bacteroidia bacterium]|nr:AMP-binding protein [Bacteroidia bacterium]